MWKNWSIETFEPSTCGFFNRGDFRPISIKQAITDSATQSLRVMGSLKKRKKKFNYRFECFPLEKNLRRKGINFATLCWCYFFPSQNLLPRFIDKLNPKICLHIESWFQVSVFSGWKFSCLLSQLTSRNFYKRWFV